MQIEWCHACTWFKVRLNYRGIYPRKIPLRCTCKSFLYKFNFLITAAPVPWFMLPISRKQKGQCSSVIKWSTKGDDSLWTSTNSSATRPSTSCRLIILWTTSSALFHPEVNNSSSIELLIKFTWWFFYLINTITVSILHLVMHPSKSPRLGFIKATSNALFFHNFIGSVYP